MMCARVRAIITTDRACKCSRLRRSVSLNGKSNVWPGIFPRYLFTYTHTRFLSVSLATFYLKFYCLRHDTPLCLRRSVVCDSFNPSTIITSFKLSDNVGDTTKLCTFLDGNEFQSSLYSRSISFFREFLAARRNSGRRYKRIILKG